MSMKNYVVNEYGLVLDRYMLKTIASQYCKDYTEEDYEEDECGFNDELYNARIVEYISEFSGEAICITDDGFCNFNNVIEYNVDWIYFIPAKRIGTLFKPAYNNIEEMVYEFKEVIGAYFTEDFDYKNHICNIVGTYYG